MDILITMNNEQGFFIEYKYISQTIYITKNILKNMSVIYLHLQTKHLGPIINDFKKVSYTFLRDCGLLLKMFLDVQDVV